MRDAVVGIQRVVKKYCRRGHMTLKWNPEIWENEPKKKSNKIPVKSDKDQTCCKHGHLWTEKTIGYVTFKKPPHVLGKKYRFCKKCKALRWRKRYNSDPAFRAKAIERNMRLYFRKKIPHGLGQVSGREQHSLCNKRTQHQEG